MQSLYRIIRSAQRQVCNNGSSKTVVLYSTKALRIDSSIETANGQFPHSVRKFSSLSPMASGLNSNGVFPSSLLFRSALTSTSQCDVVTGNFSKRCITTAVNPLQSVVPGSAPVEDVPRRIKFKRLDKTAGHIMKILDKEAVDEVRAKRDIPDIRPGYIIQLKVETPENKRRVTTMKGIVIARRNAGLNSTFRLRRLVAGVGVEALFPLYSPNIKEITVLDKKKVRRAKLYYLREKMNPLKKY